MARLWPVGLIAVVFGGIGLSGALKPARGYSADAATVQARLDALPLALGPRGEWVGVVNAISPKHLAIAEAQAHLSRTYRRPGAAVSVMLLYGEPGPLGAHTPETCYVGAGDRQRGAPATRHVGASVFWSGDFETAEDAPVGYTVNWGWGTGGEWAASGNPRFDFAAESRIYKLYASAVAPPPPPAGTPARPQPLDDFLPLLLAELRACLAPAALNPAAAP